MWWCWQAGPQSNQQIQVFFLETWMRGNFIFHEFLKNKPIRDGFSFGDSLGGWGGIFWGRGGDTWPDHITSSRIKFWAKNKNLLNFWRFDFDDEVVVHIAILPFCTIDYLHFQSKTWRGPCGTWQKGKWFPHFYQIAPIDKKGLVILPLGTAKLCGNYPHFMHTF